MTDIYLPQTFYEYAVQVEDLKTTMVTLASGYSEREIQMYHALGLAGETGEVVDCIKKGVRDGTLDREKLIKEMGDMLWYWIRLCKIFGLPPEDIAYENLLKLEDRKKRGTVGGSGDSR
jgi:NTP pyrophosphatase (non-canonical NTP hydrolase)